MSYLIQTIFIFLFCLYSCEGKTQNRTVEDSIEQSSATFSVDFPITGIDVVKSEKENPEFPDSKVVNWILEDDDGKYMYFVAQDILSNSMKEDMKLFDNGLDQLLRSVLNGGVSNYQGENLKYAKLTTGNYYGLEVNADFLNDGGKGLIKYRGYSDGHNLFVVGVVNQNPEDPNIQKFMESFEIK